MSAQAHRCVAIVGLGLIGGSLALRLLEHGYDVRGFARDPNTREAAQAAGVSTFDDRDAMLRDLPHHSIVVLAAPLPAVLQMLPEVAAATDETVTITDVVSVKAALRDAAADAGITHRFVGAHPMAGTAHSGFAAADPKLLNDAKWVLTIDEGTDLNRWASVCEMALHSGGMVVPADSEWHDHAVAWISHLPHVLAELLASNVDPRSLPAALAAGSFRDATRVAGTRPELVDAMLEGNRRMLVETLESFLDQLEQATVTLRDGSLSRLTASGFEHRTTWERRSTDPGECSTMILDLDEPESRDRLLAIGRDGGFVVSRFWSQVTALTWTPGSSS